MDALNNDDTMASYGKSIANFGAGYATTQKSVKTQGMMIAKMQTQLQTMYHQFCMGLQQQPPPRHSRATAAITRWL